MNTFRTIEDARAYGKSKPGTAAIILIEHETEGQVYTAWKAGMALVQRSLDANPQSEIAREIKRLIAEYSLKSDEEKAAEAAAILAEGVHCDRCGCQVDPKTAYSQQEWTRFCGQKVRVTAHYCKECAHLLHSIGEGEYSAMQERAGEIPSYEPYTKED